MLIQGQVGQSVGSSAQSGAQLPMRQGNMGDQIVSELHGRYYEAAYRKALFHASSTAAVATVALGTTASYTGLYLYNPLGNAYNISLLQLSYALSVAAPTAGHLLLESGYIATTALTAGGGVTPVSGLIGSGAAATALVGAGSATLPVAGTARLFLTNTSTVALTAYNGSAPQVVDVGGSIVLAPGAYVAFATLATNTAAWWFSYVWEEIPI